MFHEVASINKETNLAGWLREHQILYVNMTFQNPLLGPQVENLQSCAIQSIFAAALDCAYQFW